VVDAGHDEGARLGLVGHVGERADVEEVALALAERGDVRGGDALDAVGLAAHREDLGDRLVEELARAAEVVLVDDLAQAPEVARRGVGVDRLADLEADDLAAVGGLHVLGDADDADRGHQVVDVPVVVQVLDGVDVEQERRVAAGADDLQAPVGPAHERHRDPSAVAEGRARQHPGQHLGRALVAEVVQGQLHVDEVVADEGDAEAPADGVDELAGVDAVGHVEVVAVLGQAPQAVVGRAGERAAVDRLLEVELGHLALEDRLVVGLDAHVGARRAQADDVGRLGGVQPDREHAAGRDLEGVLLPRQLVDEVGDVLVLDLQAVAREQAHQEGTTRRVPGGSASSAAGTAPAAVRTAGLAARRSSQRLESP
jgi:hypothetical protein